MNDRTNDIDTPRGQIAKRLQDAIEELHADVARVELWASALTSFTQPIPNYSPDKAREIKKASALVSDKSANKAADEV